MSESSTTITQDELNKLPKNLEENKEEDQASNTTDATQKPHQIDKEFQEFMHDLKKLTKEDNKFT